MDDCSAPGKKSARNLACGCQGCLCDQSSAQVEPGEESSPQGLQPAAQAKPVSSLQKAIRPPCSTLAPICRVRVLVSKLACRGLAAVLSAGLLELPFPLAGPMPPWRTVFAWFGLVPLLWRTSFQRLKSSARIPCACVFRRLSLRLSLVHGQLLLGARHHVPLRRHAAAGCRRCC